MRHDEARLERANSSAPAAGTVVVIPFGDTDFIEVEPRPVGFSCRLLRRGGHEASEGDVAVIAEYPAELFAEIVRLAHTARAEWSGSTLRYS